MKITKVLGVLLLIFAASALASCGGGGSTGDDDGDDATFTANDAQSVGAGLYNSQSQAYNAISDAAWAEIEYAQSLALNLAKAVGGKRTDTGTIPINEVYNCPVSGHITSTGNFNWTIITPDPPDYVAPELSVTIRGELMEQVSDPTNNLNDCEVGNSVIMDGTVYSLFTFDWNESSGGQAKFSTDGTLGFNRRGDYGGLVMIADDCSIFFTVTINMTAAGGTSGSASGTICDESYSFSF